MNNPAVSTRVWCVITFVCLTASCKADDYARKRDEMIEHQIIARGVSNQRVIASLRSVPRHLFIPKEKRARAYEDYPVPIGYGQTISQPYIVAYMTELLKADGDDRVLEIGTGSGYQAAVLAQIVQEVYTIEIIPALGKQAETLLRSLEYRNITVKIGDGYHGWPEHAPYDGIIVTAAPEYVPQPLRYQLKEGGRMVIPVGAYPYQDLTVITRTDQGFTEDTITGVLFVPMTGEVQKKDKNH